MVVNSLQPTLHVQPDSLVNQVQTSQPVPFSSQMHIGPPISQPVQTQVHVSQPLQVSPLTQPLPPLFGASQTPLTQPLQGIL